MIRRPPRSTLFPYTSSSDLHRPQLHHLQLTLMSTYPLLLHRSEEHTSELQSQSNLVCRLLLEKKNRSQSLHPSKHFLHNYTSSSTPSTQYSRYTFIILNTIP